MGTITFAYARVMQTRMQRHLFIDALPSLKYIYKLPPGMIVNGSSILIVRPYVYMCQIAQAIALNDGYYDE